MCGHCSQALMFLLVIKAHLKYLWELLGSKIVQGKTYLTSMKLKYSKATMKRNNILASCSHVSFTYLISKTSTLDLTNYVPYMM